jgi:hypothetical protein
MLFPEHANDATASPCVDSQNVWSAAPASFHPRPTSKPASDRARCPSLMPAPGSAVLDAPGSVTFRLV